MSGAPDQRFPVWRQPDGSRFKVPQMGWNEVIQARAHPIWEGVPDASHFYFVHSFHARPSDPRHSVSPEGTTKVRAPEPPSGRSRLASALAWRKRVARGVRIIGAKPILFRLRSRTP